MSSSSPPDLNHPNLNHLQRRGTPRATRTLFFCILLVYFLHRTSAICVFVSVSVLLAMLSWQTIMISVWWNDCKMHDMQCWMRHARYMLMPGFFHLFSDFLCGHVNIHAFASYTLIKFWWDNKVNLATSAFGQTLAHLAQLCSRAGRSPPFHQQLKRPLLYTCRGFPTELTSRGQPCCFVKILLECTHACIALSNMYSNQENLQLGKTAVWDRQTNAQLKLWILEMLNVSLRLIYMKSDTSRSHVFLAVCSGSWH